LWRQELRARLSLIDQPREVIGLTLKKLGYSYNTLDLERVPHLKSELLELQKQVKFYSSKHYLQPLILGDTWLAVGWSSDILPLAARNRKIAAVVPQSGTSLWADLWVQPANFKDREAGDRASLAKQWLDYCWQLAGAKQIALFCDASSPILLNLKAEELPQDIRNNPLLSVNPALLKKSEFLAPLPPKVLAQYQDLWREMRAKR
jgi:putative spermidine/putrescine transport system substrate-binding protein